jgi:hypothetical protein
MGLSGVLDLPPVGRYDPPLWAETHHATNVVGSEELPNPESRVTTKSNLLVD